jgi:hypothetical protein
MSIARGKFQGKKVCFLQKSYGFAIFKLSKSAGVSITFGHFVYYWIYCTYFEVIRENVL